MRNLRHQIVKHQHDADCITTTLLPNVKATHVYCLCVLHSNSHHGCPGIKDNSLNILWGIWTSIAEFIRYLFSSLVRAKSKICDESLRTRENNTCLDLNGIWRPLHPEFGLSINHFVGKNRITYSSYSSQLLFLLPSYRGMFTLDTGVSTQHRKERTQVPSCEYARARWRRDL